MAEMSITVNTGSDVYEASFVKFDDPTFIILDVHYDERILADEIAQMKAITSRLTHFWRLHETDPIEGRKFDLGEVVAVKLGYVWRPAMIVDFKYVEGLNHYGLLVLDTGHIIEVNRMAFRELDEEIQLTSRYKIFGMMNLFPAEASSHESWSFDACNDLRLLLHMASSITIDVKATQMSHNIERLFGNIYVQIATHVVDVNERMLKMNAALGDSEAFKCTYHFTDQDMTNQHHEEIVSHLEQNAGVPEVEEITDQTLDAYLCESWRQGGSEPLTQAQRESICRKLRGEARIVFTHHQTIDSVLDKHLNEYPKDGNSQFPEIEIQNSRSVEKKEDAFNLPDIEGEEESVGRIFKTTHKKKYYTISENRSEEHYFGNTSEMQTGCVQGQVPVEVGMSKLSLQSDKLESHPSNPILRNIEDCEEGDEEKEPNKQSGFGRKVFPNPNQEHNIEIVSAEDEVKLLALFK